MKKEMVVGTCDLHFPPFPIKMGKTGKLSKSGGGRGIASNSVTQSRTTNGKRSNQSSMYVGNVECTTRRFAPMRDFILSELAIWRCLESFAPLYFSLTDRHSSCTRG